MRGLLLFFFLFNLFAQAQNGSSYSYSFLNLTPSARSASLGNNLITVRDGDISSSNQNPASLTADMHNKFSSTYQNLFAGINYGTVNYARNYKSVGTFAAAMQYANYGTFTLADETSTKQGDFKAADYCLNLSYGKSLDSSFSMGANIKTIYSSLYTYTSVGLAMDMAATYYNQNKLFTSTAIVKNLGAVLKPYSTFSAEREKLPFEIQLGVSQGLKHIPVRFHFIAQKLNTWNLVKYDSIPNNTSSDIVTGVTKSKQNLFFNNLGRHFIGAIEINPSKSFALRVGYDFNKRQELMLKARGGIVGFSFGFGMKIKKFRLDYGRTQTHLAGATNLFTLTLNFSDFITNPLRGTETK